MSTDYKLNTPVQPINSESYLSMCLIIRLAMQILMVKLRPSASLFICFNLFMMQKRIHEEFQNKGFQVRFQQVKEDPLSCIIKGDVGDLSASLWKYFF